MPESAAGEAPSALLPKPGMLLIPPGVLGRERQVCLKRQLEGSGCMYWNKPLSLNSSAVDLEDIIRLQSCWTRLNPLQAGL